MAESRIKISSIIDGDEVEVSTDCQVQHRGDTHTMTYTEGEHTGMEDTTTILAVSRDVVTLTRVGKYPSSFTFVAKSIQEFVLTTPMGEIDGKTNTNKLLILKNNHSISVHLGYTLTYLGNTSSCSMKISCIL